MSHKEPFAPTDPVAVFSKSVRALLATPIEVAKRKSRKPGFSGVSWLAIESFLRFLLNTTDFFTAILLSAGIVPVWRLYFEKSEDPTIWKIFVTAFCCAGIVWTWRIAVRSNDLDAVRAMILDFGKFLSGSRISKDAPTYKYLVGEYMSGYCTSRNNPIRTIRAACVCEEQDTFSVQNYYENHGRTATDWLCVMRAKRATAFLEASQFGAWLVYFHGFNRATQPTDRISRIFSTPVPFPGTPAGPKWCDSDGLLVDERFRLLAYLFINRSVGVDTKLHCFDPSQDGNLDFFHEADYILVHDPLCENFGACETLFIAIPGNERKCLRLNGRTIWSEAFRFEFYNRITQAHGSRQCDCIEDATTEKASRLAAMLGLSCNLRERWPEVKGAISAHSTNFPTSELHRLERRWGEWFPV